MNRLVLSGFYSPEEERVLLEVVILGHCEHLLVRVLSEISLLRVSQRKMAETHTKTDRKQTDG